MGIGIGIWLIGVVLSVLWLDKMGSWIQKKLQLARYFDVENCYVGDTIDLSVKLRNGSHLPISFLRLDFDLPETAKVCLNEVAETADLEDQSPYHRVGAVLKLSGKSQWQTQVKVTFNARGYYLMENLRYELTDYFGINAVKGNWHDGLELYVYPNVKPLKALVERRQLYQGVYETRRWLLEDPLVITGTRDYNNDNIKNVHWGATARMGTLQTKVYSYTSESSTMICINVQLTDRYWEGWDEALLERLIEVGAAVASESAQKREAYGLASNCPISEKSGGVMMMPATGRRHYHELFKALTKLNGYAVGGMESILNHIQRQMGKESRIVYVCAILSEAEAHQLRVLHRLGYDVDVISPDTQAIRQVIGDLPWTCLREVAYEYLA